MTPNTHSGTTSSRCWTPSARPVAGGRFPGGHLLPLAGAFSLAATMAAAGENDCAMAADLRAALERAGEVMMLVGDAPGVRVRPDGLEEPGVLGVEVWVSPETGDFSILTSDAGSGVACMQWFGHNMRPAPQGEPS